MSSFSIDVRVYYEDTDSGGIVYYANYLKFMERARTEYLRFIGSEYKHLVEGQKYIFVVRKATIDFHKPARLDDLLKVSARIIVVGSASVQFDQTIKSLASDILCKGIIKLACLDATTYRPVKIPVEFSEVLKHDS